MDMGEYCARKARLHDTTFIIQAGTGAGFYMVNGQLIPSKEFEKVNALPMSMIAFKKDKGTTRDPRNEWLTTD